jgi:hypothetical protein
MGIAILQSRADHAGLAAGKLGHGVEEMGETGQPSASAARVWA